jgi:tetratricopeptide (TPR) repeat protein
MTLRTLSVVVFLALLMLAISVVFTIASLAGLTIESALAAGVVVALALEIAAIVMSLVPARIIREERLTIRAPREAVYAAIADPRATPRRTPEVVAVDDLAGELGVVGTRWRMTHASGKVFTCEVIAAEPPARLVIRSRNVPRWPSRRAVIETERTLVATPGGTVLTIRVAARTVLMVWLVERLQRSQAARLRRWLNERFRDELEHAATFEHEGVNHSFLLEGAHYSRTDSDARPPNGSMRWTVAIVAVVVGVALAAAYNHRGWVYNIRGLAYDSKGGHNRAIADYDEAIRLDPKNAKAYYNRGASYYDKGELDRAITDYGEAIRLDPKHADTYVNRGLAYDRKGEHDRAIADYDEAIRLGPKDAPTYYNRGLAYYRKGEHDRAIADYDEAIRLDPKDADTYVNRGVAYDSKGEFDRAITEFGEAIRLDAKKAKAYYNRGVAYVSKGELDRAITEFGEAIRLDPDAANKASYYNARGLVYASTRDYARAIADYDQALTLNLDDRSLAEVRQNRERAQTAIATPPE